MSRYNPEPDHDITKLLKFADEWREKCLLDEGSLFSNERLWTDKNCVERLPACMVNCIYDGKGYATNEYILSNLKKRLTGEKFKDDRGAIQQLEDSSSELKKLMAEIYCIVYLVDSSQKSDNKIGWLREIWGWSGESLPDEMRIREYLQEGVKDGWPGPWEEIDYLVQFVKFWKEQGNKDHPGLIADSANKDNAWKFAEVLHDAEELYGWNNSGKIMRNTLVYLLFPDYFERIFASGNKKMIAIKLIGVKNVSQMKLYEIDKYMYDYRMEKEESPGTDKLDYFHYPLGVDKNGKPWAWDQVYKDGKPMNQENSLELNPVSPTNSENETMYPLNQILYGPPGTGKTYRTKKLAVKIIDGGANADTFKQRYKKLEDGGQIVFTTFHQSYGYEEFIEGIKPVLDDARDDGQIRYKIKEGIFKQLCEQAKDSERDSFQEAEITEEDGFQETATPEEDNFDEVIAELIRRCDERSGYGPPVLLRTKMKNREFRVVYRGNSFHTIPKNGNGTAVGIISVENLRKRYETGGYASIPPGAVLLSYAKSLYEYMVQELGLKEKQPGSNKKNYVLIIDEINRGNISKIFGELITLIEDNKRGGNDDQLSVTLPYSGDQFSVPNNLYIIGTMNTADRSIAFLDTALRRRFSFVEMMPDYTVLNNLEDEDIKIDEMLKKINERIVDQHDRNHQIGHAYFMGIKTVADLADVFEKKIIPLLREYFFDDAEKISEVLNGAFFAGGKLLEGKPLGEALRKPENYRKIYAENAE